MWSLTGMLWLVMIQVAWGIIAYDCGGFELNYTSLSILDIGECDSRPVVTEESQTYIQVLQMQEVYDIMVYSCKISVTYLVSHCGMHSHASMVKGGLVSRVLELTNQECRDTMRFKSAYVYGRTVNGLRVNSSISTSVTLAGKIDSSGQCKGAVFIDGVHSWDDVTVQATIAITLSEHLASYTVEDSKVRLNSGTTCTYKDFQCMDFENGPTYWDSVTAHDCSPNSYMTLYTGKAYKVRVNDTSMSTISSTMYTIRDQKMLATLTVLHSIPLCHLTAYQSDHPKLIIYESPNQDFYFQKNKPSVKNMDLFLYVNSKFAYLEGHLKNSLNTMYSNIVYQKCKLERIVLQNQLSLALTSPSEFAYAYMGKPGYTAITLGETVHVIKCTPVDVNVMRYDECIQELPVKYRNNTMFMTPKTHIIQSRATPLTCTPILKPKYRLNGKWFSYVGELIDSNIPATLTPNQELEWVYTHAGDLMTQGIYTQDDLTALKKQMMYPLERKAIEQIVTSNLNHERVGMLGVDKGAFYDSDRIKEEIESYWARVWGSFTLFGNFSAGLIGIMLIFKLVKFLFDSIVHGYALYDLYGLSWYLLGCFWDAVTTCLLRPPMKENATPNTKGGEQPDTETSTPVKSTPSRTKLYPSISPGITDNEMY